MPSISAFASCMSRNAKVSHGVNITESKDCVVNIIIMITID